MIWILGEAPGTRHSGSRTHPDRWRSILAHGWEQLGPSHIPLTSLSIRRSAPVADPAPAGHKAGSGGAECQRPVDPQVDRQVGRYEWTRAWALDGEALPPLLRNRGAAPERPTVAAPPTGNRDRVSCLWRQSCWAALLVSEAQLHRRNESLRGLAGHGLPLHCFASSTIRLIRYIVPSSGFVMAQSSILCTPRMRKHPTRQSEMCSG